MLTELWQVTAMHFHLLAYSKTKPSFIRGLSSLHLWGVLSPMPSVLHVCASSIARQGPTCLNPRTCLRTATTEEVKMHLTVKTARSFSHVLTANSSCGRVGITTALHAPMQTHHGIIARDDTYGSFTRIHVTTNVAFYQTETFIHASRSFR